jgi:hypothetical protein
MIQLRPTYVFSITLDPSEGQGDIVIEQPAASVLLSIAPFYKGDPGEPGSAAQKYTHTQASPSDTWTINHGLGLRPSVALFTIGWVSIDAFVLHTSDNQTVVQFNSPQTGYAICQ